jgi:acyl-coenzyme A thioesterase PaaI-like protein
MFHSHRVTGKQPNSKMCLVCGLQNDLGLKAAFYELENQQLVGLFTPSHFQQGYPGRLHGGLATTMLDETIGRAIRVSHGDTLWGVTIELNTKFRKPIPLDGPIKTVAHITKESKRHFEGRGAILLDGGQIAVEAHGRYLKMSIESIADFDFEEQQWCVVSSTDDPHTIELPADWSSASDSAP